LRRVIAERLGYYHEARLHSGLGYRTPREALEEVLSRVDQGLTRQTGRSV
ncbi:IS3 family transposase, partial [Meiothermus sp. Pnk-1]